MRRDPRQPIYRTLKKELGNYLETLAAELGDAKGGVAADRDADFEQEEPDDFAWDEWRVTDGKEVAHAVRALSKQPGLTSARRSARRSARTSLCRRS